MDPLRNIPRLSELSGNLRRLSTTDRGTLSRLTSVSDIQEWTRTKADEYHQFSLALLAIHNLAAPIHRLPTEVLELVFSDSWNDRKGLHLSYVCGLWRSILLGRAAFWADAATSCGPLFDKKQVVYDELPFIDTLLSRSVRHSRGLKPFFHGFTRNIIKSLTPYIGNVVSLRVTLDSQSDLYEGLWPTLRSRMPKLGALHVDLTNRKADIRDHDYDELGIAWEWDLDEDLRAPLAMLSHESLPQLSHLTCPPTMVRFFGGVRLRHVTIVGGCGVSQGFSKGNIPRRLLEPYRHCLEVLEITGEVKWYAARPPDTEALQFSSLHTLRVMSCDVEATRALLSLLALPRTAHIHITDCNNLRHPRFQQLFSSDDSTALRSAVASIDHVHIQCPSSRWLSGDHTLLCISGNAERLRLENYHVIPQDLVAVFGTHASVTRLTLSLAAKDSLQVDFRAFPHLVHLDMTGPDMDPLARMLGPTDKLRGRPAKLKPALCLSLADLVITCGLAVQQAATNPPPAPKPKSKPKPRGRAKSSRSKSKIDNNPSPSPSPSPSPPADVDEVFEQRCSILQRVLTRRASSGTRLTSLTLRLHPVTRTILGQRKKPGDTGSAEPAAVWPSLPARQSVLESLQELVDGPVVIKLLDQAGVEANVEEAET
ncbi:hypothetical protein V8D89_003690 [Ganoderma adspersum]